VLGINRCTHIGFPKPRRVNGRKYDAIEDVQEWLARRENDLAGAPA